MIAPLSPAECAGPPFGFARGPCRCGDDAITTDIFYALIREFGLVR